MGDIKLTFHKASTETERSIPLAQSSVKAGFPSPAQDYLNEEIDLNKLLIPHPEATFFVKISGDSMMDAGILDGDMVFVRQCETASNGEIVVALIEDSATVKTFYKENGHIRLQPENDAMDPIIVDDCKILGKVFGVFRLM